MNEAIKLAIEKGGYDKPYIKVVNDGLYTFGDKFHKNELENLCVLDPLFWQALGKALGWYRKPNKNTYRDGAKVTHCGVEGKSHNAHWYCPRCEKYEWDTDFYPMWLFFALQYTETLLRSGDTEKFWSDLC